MYPYIFEVRIDSESKRFFAGQVVEGRVILVLHKEKVVKGVTIYNTLKHLYLFVQHNPVLVLDVMNDI